MLNKTFKTTWLIAAAAVLFASSCANAATIHAKDIELFNGWVGKTQKAFYEDGDFKNWSTCFSSTNGSCSASTKSSTVGACRSTEFGIGADWELPMKIPGLSLSGSASHSWTECNERSESTECTPHVGFKGGTAVLVSERIGRTKYLGVFAIPLGKVKLPANYFVSNYQGSKIYQYSGAPIITQGYLPEYRAYGCQYVRPWVN
ncbi:hypothetical protein [Xanthomonas arboricola]|uniref:hypothetical protein n=1 Tax=Xanthomonas arboricola TaxID=56448 RepID=UPI000E1EF315|nr:hypothetical protein [Xanthomonas arboricola]